VSTLEEQAKTRLQNLLPVAMPDAHPPFAFFRGGSIMAATLQVVRNDLVSRSRHAAICTWPISAFLPSAERNLVFGSTILMNLPAVGNGI